MSVRTSVILIPYWIAESLKRGQMQPKDCIDFRKVKSVVSTHDLMTLIAAQDITSELIGAREGGAYGGFALGGLWEQSIQASITPEEKRDLESYFDIATKGDYISEVRARLYSPEANGPTHSPTYEKPFNIYDLMPDVIGVVVNPGFFTEKPNKALQLSLVEAVLKSLYVYNTPTHEVATTSWFGRFMELLAGK